MSFDTHDEISPEPKEVLEPSVVSGDTYEDRFEVSTRSSKVSRMASRSRNRFSKPEDLSLTRPSRRRKSRDRVQVANSDADVAQNQIFDIEDNYKVTEATSVDRIKETNSNNSQAQIEADNVASNEQTQNNAKVKSGGVAQAPVTKREPIVPPEFEQFRSAGLDSLFSSTAPEKAEKGSVKESAPEIKEDSNSTTEESEKEEPKINVKRGRFADVGYSVPEPKSKEKSKVEAPKPVVEPVQASAQPADSTKDTSKEQTGKLKIPSSLSGKIFKKPKPQRKVQIIRPTSYAGVKEIADALSVGNVVALSLMRVNIKERVRVLDFAFGAASVCGARVSVEGQQLYMFTIGERLTASERRFCKEAGLNIND